MSLIKCPECGIDVNNYENKCSNCGYPITSCNEDEKDLNTDKILEENENKIILDNVINENKTINADNKSNSLVGTLKSMKNVVCIISIVFFILGSIFMYKGFDKKDNYYSSEYSYSLNKNAYVGGDAYNYIINGTYFTGYSILAGSSFIISTMLFVSLVGISIKIKELESKLG